MDFSAPILIVALFTLGFLTTNLIVAMLDETRVKSYLAARGCELQVAAWSTPTHVPIFLLFRRTYDVVYVNQEGIRCSAECIIRTDLQISVTNRRSQDGRHQGDWRHKTVRLVMAEEANSI